MYRIFSKRTLREFWAKHPDSEQYLKTWYETAINSNWTSPAEVKQNYANASILKNGRIVFNVKGNDYRLVVRFNFEKQWVFVRFVGRHSEYDKIDANNV
jgi:mRNA interferase HigB